jgi:hypothetical protein
MEKIHDTAGVDRYSVASLLIWKGRCTQSFVKRRIPMLFKLPRKLYPLFAAFFALSLVLGACGEGGEVGEEPVIEEGVGEEGAEGGD